MATSGLVTGSDPSVAVSGVGAVFLLKRMAERGAAVNQSECPNRLPFGGSAQISSWVTVMVTLLSTIGGWEGGNALKTEGGVGC